MGAKKLKTEAVFLSNKGEEVPVRIVEEMPSAFRVQITKETGSYRMGRTFTAKKDRVSVFSRAGAKPERQGATHHPAPIQATSEEREANSLALVRSMPRSEKSINWDAVTKDISSVLNRHCIDTITSSPDFALADFVVDNIKVTREFLITRKKWRGPEQTAVCKEDFGGVI